MSYLTPEEMSRLRTASVAAVRHAAALTRAVQRTLASGDTLTKADASPVTVADLGVQAVVALSLTAQLHSAPGAPPFRLLAEEDAATFRAGGPALVAHVVAAVNAAYPKARARAEVAAAGGSLADGPLARALAPGAGEQWSADDVADAIAAGEYGQQLQSQPEPAAAATTNSNSASDTTSYFVLDPVDGTKGFLRGAAEPGAGHQFCIGLAYVHDGLPVVGVLGCPSLPFPSLKPAAPAAAPRRRGLSATSDGSGSLDGYRCEGTLFSAQAGYGAHQEPLAEGQDAAAAAALARPVTTDAATVEDGDASGAVVCESYEAGHSDHGLSSRVAASLGIAAPPVRMDSMCKYGLLARGDGHVYLRFPRRGYVEKVWDHAAGSVVLREAGGVVTDAAGRPLDFSHGATLARNVGVLASADPALHTRVVDAVEAAGRETAAAGDAATASSTTA